MKQNLFITCVFAGTFITAPLFAEKVERADLPRAVQAAIITEGRGAQVSEIDRKEKDGRVVYEVSYKEEGKARRASISEDGSLLKESDSKKVEVSNSVKLPTFKKEKIELSSLPQAVQDAVKTQMADGEVVDIDKENRDGKLTYEIEFKRDGKNQDIWVAEDGTLMPPKKVDRLFGSAREADKQQLRDLPEAAQSTIRTRAGTGEVGDIVRRNKDGKVVYAVKVNRAGRDEQFFVAEDGTVVESAGGEVSIVEKAESKLKNFGDKVENRITDLRSKKVTYNQLPAAVQKTIQDQAGSTPEIIDVEREDHKGRIVYEVEFRKEGKNSEIHVAEDGSLVEQKP